MVGVGSWWRLGPGCHLRSGLGLGTGSRWRRTSSRRCGGNGAGQGGLPGLLPGRLGRLCSGWGASGRQVHGCGFPLALALRMSSAERGEEEVDDDEEDEDEEEVVVLGDAGCAVIQAGAAFRAAAASAADNAGKTEGISSGCCLGAGGWRIPAATWQPSGPMWSAAVRGGGVGLWSLPSGFGGGGRVHAGCIRASEGLGLG